jgi:hypothetical protein
MDPDGDYPMGVTEHVSGFSSIIGLVSTRENRENRTFDRNHHKKFIFQGLNYLIHSPYEMFSKDSAVHQCIVNHSMIVYLNPQKTIIDKALEDYEPKRYEKVHSTSALCWQLSVKFWGSSLWSFTAFEVLNTVWLF